ncbi:MAG TPA: DUF4388 domain-containing protein [Mycobacteriales bacterium]|nr:DUF4388 domain-containing protein [Mycobacteriales bacterium]
MLKGDLTTTPLVPLLRSLADDIATGCLHVFDSEGDEALVYVKNGLIYSVSVPGRRPQLGSRLVSSGALAPEALAEALEAQRTELQGWRLGELLVHLSYVDQPVVEDFVNEQVHEAMWDLLRWQEGSWKFRKNERTREDVASPVAIDDLVTVLRERQDRWEEIAAVVHGPTAVPTLSARGNTQPELTLDPDAWSLLCKVDGERSVAELARECGYTLFEVGRVLVNLVASGLVDVEDDLTDESPPPVPVDRVDLVGRMTSALTGLFEPEPEFDEPVDDTAPALARLVTAVTTGERAAELPSVVAINQKSASFADAISRVSTALSDLLGPQSAIEDPYEVPAELRRRSPRVATAVRVVVDPERERRDRIRAAASAELAAAHAMAEAAHREAREPEAQVADVVDLDVVRRESAAREQAAAQRAAEEAEDERLAEEAARLAAEQETARLAAEYEAAEADAWTEYWIREAEEQAAREAAEAAAREAAARLAAETDAWTEYWMREAQEQAAREAAEAAAREAADRLAAETDAWTEYWIREAQEQNRLAAEEQARADAELAEEAARAAAEEQARAEAEAEAAEATERAELQALADLEHDLANPARTVASAEVFAEFSAALASITEPEATTLVADPEPELEPEPERGPVRSELADTAALLRELSSLGLEDAPPPPPVRPSSPGHPRPSAQPSAADKKTKKRGFFSR